MADIRINALATTAASTASDDFIAVDGNANGTRKLNAYSPTFGGNLTVSGGTATVGASGGGNGSLVLKRSSDGLTVGNLSVDTTNSLLNLNTAYSFATISTEGVERLRVGTITTTLAGNLTASGNGVFGSSSGASAAQLNAWNDQAAPTRLLISNQTNNASSLVGIDFEAYGGGWQVDVPRSTTFVNPLVFKFNSSEQARFTSGGNLLIGTTTDAGYALQVKSASDKNLVLDVASGQRFTSLYFSNNSSGKAGFYWDNTDSVFNMGALAGGSTKILSGSSVVALTLDSSQNATFAGDATWNKNGNITVTLATASTSSGATNRIRLATPASTSDTRCGVIEFYKNGSTFNGDLRFNVAGGIALRNSADTVTFETDDNKNFVLNSGAVATNATNGFIYVATCAGTPTGTPTSYTGRAPIVVDTTNNKLYFYSGGAWRDAGP